MAYFFYALGTVVVLIGLAWSGLILGQPFAENHLVLAVMAKALAMIPGLGVTGSGLLFLAIGGMLHRLDKIAHRSADTAMAMDMMAKRLGEPVLDSTRLP